MIPLTELQHFVDPQPAYRILKPWWDVFTDYISVVLLLIAVFGGTLQVTQDKMICLPCRRGVDNACQTDSDSPPATSELLDHKGIQTRLDLHQYNFVDVACYESTLHWFAKYFPHLLFLHTLIFLACSNFWFKFPQTSSKLQQFLSILLKCFDSPWTTRALSETVVEERDPMPLQTTADRGGSVLREHAHRSKTRFERSVADRTETGVLDKKEGERAKALFEKVKKFRIYVEEGNVVHRLYVCQTVVKVVKFIFIMCYTGRYVWDIEFSVDCSLNTEGVTGYGLYRCAHQLATPFQLLVCFYLSLVAAYGLVCTYTLWWMLRRSLRNYSFESVREESSYSDIPDGRNDFAFMLHMVDQYDPLYSKCFAVFLSEVNEQKLSRLDLNNEWTLDKLRQRISKNLQGKLELHLFMLSGIPDKVFDLMELEVLKLELIPDFTLPPTIAQLVHLREMWLHHTVARIEAPALSYLCDNLTSLHIKFADVKELPLWIYSLKNVRELHLTGNLSAEGNSYTFIDGLQELKLLEALHLKNNLAKIPQVVTDVGPHLQKLSIDNEGTKLMALNSLKKMVNLRELELIWCDLERIPHSIFSLRGLEAIDLRDNHLRTIEEIISFQHLRRLVCLKLWYNQIAYIPVHVGTLTNLEKLYLNRNRIEDIPSQLFLCQKLRILDLSHNNLTCIPTEIVFLQNLQTLSVTANRIESLPNELVQCKKLRTLKLGNNCLQRLPSGLGELSELTHLELRGNGLGFLPAELGMCRRLKRSGLVVEEELYNALPAEVKDQLGKVEKEAAS